MEFDCCDFRDEESANFKADGFQGQDELEEDDEDFQPDVQSLKDAVLFVVEISIDIIKSIGEEDDEKYMQYTIVIEAIENFLKAKIINSPNDRIGVVFYNTIISNIQDFDNQYQILKLQNPSAEGIQKIKKTHLEQEFVKICGKPKFPGKQNVSLRDVLWNAANQLKELKREEYTRRIFLFTCNDNPHENDNEAKRNAIFQARNLLDMDIAIELFPLKKLLPQPSFFNITKFYSQIINFDVNEINEATIDGTEKIYDLKTRIRCKLFKKRTISRLFWSFNDDVKVGVKLYSLYNKIANPTAKPLYKLDPSKMLRKVTKTICRDTGEQIQKSQIGYCYRLIKNLNKRECIKVGVSKQEIITNAYMGMDVGMKLLGFKDRSSLKNYYNLRPSQFIYPDDSLVKGSSKVFDALITEMIRKEKVAIVKIIPRKGSQLRFGCLLPQQEEYNPTDHTQTPPGLHIVYLPYHNDIRDSEEMKSGSTIVSQEMIMITKMFMNMMTLQDFDFKNFEDPQLGKFYATLEAFALGEKEPEQIPDLMQPDYEKLNQYEEIIELFGQGLKLESETNEDEYIVKTRRRKRNLDEFNKNQLSNEYVVEEPAKVQKYLKEIFEEENKKNMPKPPPPPVINLKKEEKQISQQSKPSTTQQSTKQNTSNTTAQNLKQEIFVVPQKQFVSKPQINVKQEQQSTKIPQQKLTVQQKIPPKISSNIVLRKNLSKEEKAFVESIKKKVLEKIYVTDEEIRKYCACTTDPL